MSRVTLITCDRCKREIKEGQEIHLPELRLGHDKTRWKAEPAQGDSEDNYMDPENFERVPTDLEDICRECYDEIFARVTEIMQRS